MKADAQRASWRTPPATVFAEDFDDPPPPLSPRPAAPEPARPEELFTREQVDGARADGLREGRARALAEDALARRRSALEDVAHTLRATREEAADAAERAAEELARLLLASLAAVLPERCRQHGDAEAKAVLRAILPGVSREPRVTVRASERTTAALAAELAGMDPEAVAHLTLASSGTMVDGDVRITWAHGSAQRDAAAVWREIEAALGLAGLAQPRPAAVKESVDA